MKFYLFAAAMLFCAVTFGQNTAFDSIQVKVNDCVTKSQWDELLVTAPELITAEPTKPDGYYYTAMAFYKLQENEKAQEYLTMAEQLADESFKKKIADLKVDIANGTKASKMAETIIKNGEDKNAADDYRKLWEIDKTKIEYALNAVEWYVEKENYVAALEILNAPALASDAQAKILITKINQKPKMVALNGYNKAMKEGDEKFKQEAYKTAISKFDEAMTFYAKDAKASSYKRKAQEELAWQVAGNLNSVESYKSYLAKYPLGKYKSNADDILQRAYLRFARDYVKENKFSDAVNYYQIYQKSYPKGPQINIVNKELCELYFAEAKRNEKVKQPYNMTLALEQYALAKKCGINRVSSAHLKSLKRKEVRWGRDDMTFLGWHADETNLLGIMSGSLNNRKLGMYVALRVSNDIWQAGDASWETDNSNSLTESTDKNKKYNGKSYNRVFFGTIGITKKITHPLWVYAGAGVCINSQVREFEHNTTGKVENVKNKDLNYIAVNPEIGLQVKLAFLTIRYGINKPLTPLFKEQFMQHFGVGIKF
ncbi:hypothetical protein [Ferruginibacter sp.]|nr:hypothetical protein [Ferruginibacter sp.]